MRKKPPITATTGPLVVALAYDGLCTFEFAIAAEIFSLHRPEMGPGWYRWAACGIEPGPLRAQGGLRVEVDGGLPLLDRADLIVVPGWKGAAVPVPARLRTALIRAHARGARLASICSGAFVLAATGLLDGHRAATHWRYADALQRAYPRVRVDAEVLYVDERRIATSAGSAAGIDLMLHRVRADFGAAAANSVARRLVVPAHRNGGQAQFIERPVPPRPDSRFAALFDRLRREPARDWRIADMADAAAMSERSFLRHFTQSTGQSPLAWLNGLRVDEARRLLETRDLPIEQVAQHCGFGSVATLRHHFGRATALTPSEYRARFARTRAAQRAA